MTQIEEIIGKQAADKLIAIARLELENRARNLPCLNNETFNPVLACFRIEEFENFNPTQILNFAEQWVYEAFEVDRSEILLKATLRTLDSIDYHPEQIIQPRYIPRGIITDSIQQEIEKRRLVNCLIAGAGHSCQNIFQMKDQELAEINPDLMENYKAVMLMAESQYWSMDNETFEIAKQFSKPAGLVELKNDENGHTTIHAQGLMLPVLLLELGKGIMQTIARHGLPVDAETRELVKAEADKLVNELEETRIGKQLYRALIQSRSGEELNGRIVDFLYQIVKLPAPEFISRIKKAIDLLPE